MVNRGAVSLRYLPPAVRWINEAVPAPGGAKISSEQVNEDRTLYLIRDSDADVRRWIERHFRALFDTELESWCTDPASWPAERTLALFDEWFAVESHTVLIDTVGGPIIDDEA